MVLLFVVFLMIAMAGITGSMAYLSRTRSQTLGHAVEHKGAFYLAEAGVEAAKWEITLESDSDGDGMGSKSETLDNGSYRAVAVELGDGSFEITSTGTSGSREVTLQSVIGYSETPGLPAGAISIVGDVDREKFRVRPHGDVLIDGGDVAAFTLTDPEFFQELGKDIAKDVVAGRLPAESIAGSIKNWFDADGDKKEKKTPDLPSDIRKHLESTLGEEAAALVIEQVQNGELPPGDLEDDLPYKLLDEYEDWRRKAEYADGKVELSIHQQDGYEDAAAAMNALYDQLIARVEELIPTATHSILENEQVVKKQLAAEKDALAKSEKWTKQLEKSDGQIAEYETDIAKARAELVEVSASTDLEEDKKQKQVEDLAEKIVKLEAKVVEERAERDAAAAELATIEADLEAVVDLENRLSSNELSFGTAEEPAVVYLAKKAVLFDGDHLTGHGTLIIEDQLKIRKGASIDWNGDVIVMGNVQRDRFADIRVRGEMTVEGNVMVLGRGEKDRNVSFLIDGGGKAAIDGSLSLCTDWADDDKQRAQLRVWDGTFDVNGLVTMIGRKVKGAFRHDSDVSITGMWQMAMPTDSGKEKFEMVIDGKLEVTKDNDWIRKGAESLREFGAEMNIDGAMSGTILKKSVVSRSWKEVHQ